MCNFLYVYMIVLDMEMIIVFNGYEKVVRVIVLLEVYV